MNIGNILLLFFEYADVIGMAIVLLVLLLRRDSTILENKYFFLIYYGIFFISSLFASLIPDIIKLKSNNWIYDNIPLFLCLVLFFYFQKIFKSAFSKKLNGIIFSLFIVFYIFNSGRSISRILRSSSLHVFVRNLF